VLSQQQRLTRSGSGEQHWRGTVKTEKKFRKFRMLGRNSHEKVGLYPERCGEEKMAFAEKAIDDREHDTGVQSE
jgi:hypothetical protein